MVTRRVCCVDKCKNTNSGCVKLFALPKDSLRRQQWLGKLKLRKLRCNTEIENVRVCSIHFVTGKPALPYYSSNHIDWVPTCVLDGMPEKLGEVRAADAFEELDVIINTQEEPIENTVSSQPENEISASNNNIDVLHDNTFISTKIQSEITVLQEKLKFSDGSIVV